MEEVYLAKIHPRIFIENSHLPLVKCPRILGVYLDPSLSFNKHSQYVAERVSGRNNILKALAGTSWGQQKETLLMTYKAVGRSIINYAAPVWSPNLHDANYRKIQYTQNEALRIATGCHKMSSIDHLHTEAEMLKVRITQSFCLHSNWSDVWNQEMYVITSQQGSSLKDR